MAEGQVRHELEAERVTALLQGAHDLYLPLPVAAAIAFHQSQGNTRAIITRQDYDDALNLAAAALSRLITIYVLRDPREGRVPLAVDLTKSQFVRGATKLRTGNETQGELSVARRELLSALSLIKRAGLPLMFGKPKDA
jgi:hypothetical protein